MIIPNILQGEWNFQSFKPKFTINKFDLVINIVEVLKIWFLVLFPVITL